jgi:hypothetical protein
MSRMANAIQTFDISKRRGLTRPDAGRGQTLFLIPGLVNIVTFSVPAHTSLLLVAALNGAFSLSVARGDTRAVRMQAREAKTGVVVIVSCFYTVNVMCNR